MGWKKAIVSTFKYLKAEFRERFIPFADRIPVDDPHAMLLLKASDAEEFLLRGITAGLHPTGLEGFLVTAEGAIQPDQAMSLNSMYFASQSELVHNALRLLSQFKGNDSAVFEVWFE